MAIRYITYDIGEGNSYDSLYEFLQEIKAEEITESTYKIESNIEFEDLCNKVKNVTSDGDSVYIIFRNEYSITHKMIR